MQTILGSGGAIGQDLASLLVEHTDRIRLVSRNPQPVDPGNEPFPADLTRADDVMRAVEGSDVAYLVAGLQYKADVWEAEWPLVMNNVLAACRTHGTRLVFFDNVYMYDRDHLGAMDEDTPVRPSSRKGEVRARIADVLMEADARGDVRALIARSADFYGPGRQKNSVLTQSVFERLVAGKSAQWLMSSGCRHSFTFTPDASKGTAILGNSDDAFGQVWHLPTAPQAPTGEQWIDAIAAALGVESRVQVAGDFLMRVLGLFVPVLREVREMAYQYDRDYVFLSEKFDERFGLEPTSIDEGIARIIAADYPR